MKRGDRCNSNFSNNLSNSINFNPNFNPESNKKLGKKAGVTTYIILGLIILIVVSVIIFIVTRETSQQAQRERENIQRLPSEVQPIALIVDQCLRDTSRQAVGLLGQQGGNLDIGTEQSNLVFGYYATESDGVTLTKNLNSPKIPYWYYLSSPSDCLNCDFKSNAPSIQDMEKSIENYINTNLKNCVNDFEFLQNQYEIEILDEPKSDVKIGTSLSISLDYPVKINTFTGEFSHSQSSINLQVNLKQIHEIAKEITDYEIDNSFIERIVFNLISAYSSIDSEFPPIAGTELGYERSIWIKSIVRNHAQDMIRDSMFLLTIPGTRNFFPALVDEDEIPSAIKQGYLYSMVVPIFENGLNNNDLNGKYSKTDVNFFYFDWPIYFDITPNEGEIIRPEELGTDFFGFLPLASQSYEFSYDIAIPVVVELRDAEAFNGEGYSFMFALEGNIRDNSPFKDQDYEILYDSAGESTSLFTSPSQRISGTITVEAIDEQQTSVAGTNIEYLCGSESAYIGTTGDDGRLRSKFPICNGGIVRFYKDGYLKANSPLNTKVGVDDGVSGKIYKIYDIQAEVGVVRPDAIDQINNLATGSLTPSEYEDIVSQSKSELENEEVIFTISRINETLFDDTYTQILYFQDNTPQNLRLPQGTYSVQATYLDNDGFILNKSTRKIKYKDPDTLGLTSKTKEITLPEVNINPAPFGGVSLNQDTGYWIVDGEDLMNVNGADNSVTLFVIRSKDPEKHEELASIGDYEILSGQYRSLVEPRWS